MNTASSQINRQNFGRAAERVMEKDAESFFREALSLHRQNRLDEAEVLYRQVLTVEPNHSGALHFLGMVAFARKNFPEAIRYMESSLRHCDFKPVYFNNYGVVLKEQHRYTEAETAFEKYPFHG